jgi:hypothetical protein
MSGQLALHSGLRRVDMSVAPFLISAAAGLTGRTCMTSLPGPGRLPAGGAAA